MNYHRITDIDPHNLEEVIKFAKELYEYQNIAANNSEEWWDCCDFMNKYMQVNTTMYVVLSTVALAFDYDLHMIDAGGDIYGLDSILTKFSVSQVDVLNGIQRNPANINMLASLITTASVPFCADRFLVMYLIDTLYYHTEAVRINLRLYNDGVRNYDLLLCNIILDAIAILQRRIRPVSDLMTASNDIRMLSTSHNSDLSVMLTDIIFRENIIVQNATREECEKYLCQSDITYLLYTYIMPTICISSVVGLYETLRLIRRMVC